MRRNLGRSMVIARTLLAGLAFALPASAQRARSVESGIEEAGVDSMRASVEFAGFVSNPDGTGPPPSSNTVRASTRVV